MIPLANRDHPLGASQESCYNCYSNRILILKPRKAAKPEIMIISSWIHLHGYKELAMVYIQVEPINIYYLNPRIEGTICKTPQDSLRENHGKPTA